MAMGIQIDLEKIRGFKKRLRQTDVRAESYDHLKFSILKSEGGFEFVKHQTAITRASAVRFRRFFF